MLIPLFQNLTPKQANAYGLIISAAGIFYEAKKERFEWQLWVHDHDKNEALFHIQKYIQENPESQQPLSRSITQKIQFLDGIWVAVVLLAVHMAVGDDRELFVTIYGASASKIMAGEFYRTATALLLHADDVHLAGNMAAIAFFGAVVCALNGAGVGWLMILLSGIAGNYMNAWLYQTSHMAVGASTAVFGAVGMMATYMFWRKIKQPEERFRSWIPIAGGIALLGIFGVGEGRVDIMAHLFGFTSGVIIQSAYQGLTLIRRKQVLPVKYQVVCLAIALTVLGLSCVWPVMK